MIRIRSEEDLKLWFKKNYKKLGFQKILRYDQMRFPDFIVLENGKKVRVELEIKSSNFILHNHSTKKVDKVICIEKDVQLKVPIIELKNFKLVGKLLKSPYSYEKQISNIMKKETVVTSSEIAKLMKINWSTANRYLTELLMNGTLRRIKKEGVTLWLKK